ncbi:MAG: anhydro-N-acetylmuramic acid kinase [Candidatus Eremiobacteraeota bacterium]|nr:anhydro-N-acetylmuramic acid kinase [Candidatus Eremiobacteraeota bacterium]
MYIASLDKPVEISTTLGRTEVRPKSGLVRQKWNRPDGEPLLNGYPCHDYRQVLGMISGTSADGVDLARVLFPPAESEEGLEVLEFNTIPYPADLKAEVLRAAADELSLRQTAKLHGRLSDFFAEVAAKATSQSPVDLIASHGQTVCHLPENGTTLQLGDGSVIANRTGVVTVSDFRTADMALGGQGAPLVPLFDSHLLAHPSLTRIAVNLGGIANITVISPGARSVCAWDTGPANCVSDALCRLRGQGEFDPDGVGASSGRVDEELLGRLLEMEYFARSHPKSTGLEDFGESFARTLPADMRFEDCLRTALALSAQSLVDAIIEQAPERGAVELVFAGGGTANRTLMQEIAERLERAAKKAGVEAPRSRSFKDFGVGEECREAAAFAFLGDRTARGLVGSVPSTTGAHRAAILGKISFPSP